MHYKGYKAVVEFDEDAGIYHGEVMGLRDVITFQSMDADGLKQAFVESVEDYLAFCKEQGEAAGFLTLCIETEQPGVRVDLPGNIIEHRSRRRFARHECPTRITHQAELHREAKLVVVTSAKLNFQSISRRQGIMADQAIFISWDVEKLMAVPNF